MSATGRLVLQTSQETSAGSRSLREPNLGARVPENEMWQDSSFDEKLWTTSQETIPDTDIDDNHEELDNCDDDAERRSKRRCLTSPYNHNDSSWKSILDPHPR